MSARPAGSVVADHLWYVAYGSNLLRERLLCYLAGGRPPGGRRDNPGARDSRPPTAHRAVELPHPIMFGGPSRTWRGGPAYLDVERDGAADGRGWRITHEQFEDLVAQENGLAPGAVSISAAVLSEGGVVVPSGYGRIVPLDSIDGEPAATVTYVRRPIDRDPDPAYLELIRRGLAELG